MARFGKLPARRDWVFQDLSENASITSSNTAKNTQGWCMNASQFIVP